MNVKKLTFLSIAVALAMILSFVESQIPPFVAIPGVKVGLSNIVTVFLIYTYGWREAGAVSLIRVVLSSLLFSSFVGLLYSLSGALLSFILMLIMKKTGLFSVIGVSVVGGVSHNAGQIICACFVMENAAISYYLPPLIISGVIAGVAVGILSGIITEKLKGKI